ncbi:MAG TPA: hypothetical protein VG028_18295 [Terriglobia bacterium]|nr:hypothetical protein [Terriglobia bacterium]
MIEEINTRQTVQDEASTVPSGQTRRTVGTHSVAERTTRFNRYLYENLVTNVEVQIESWNRQAGRESDPQVAQAFRLKAEGLGYTLRLLDAFQPEFRELIDTATQCAANGGT